MAEFLNNLLCHVSCMLLLLFMKAIYGSHGFFLLDEGFIASNLYRKLECFFSAVCESKYLIAQLGFKVFGKKHFRQEKDFLNI